MKLYNELADWWPLMSTPAEYEADAAGIARLLDLEGTARRLRVLELGSGAGHLAFHLKRRFEMTLVDLSPRMLALSRKLNPECRHLEGDMRTLQLGESFDAVLIFDAVSHLYEPGDLLAALRTARAHLQAGGVGVFCPDATVECFNPVTTHGGTDGTDRALRYLEWTRPDINGTSYWVDIVYLLRTTTDRLRIEHDHVRLGVFTRAAWIEALHKAGFGSAAVETQSSRDVFVARVHGPGSEQ